MRRRWRGGASPNDVRSTLRQIAASYLDANGADRDVSDCHVRKIKNDKAHRRTFRVEVKGSLPRYQLHVAGGNSEHRRSAPCPRSSAAPAGPLEMVLALDTTYSMTDRNDKIGTLKTAATDLVNEVMTI